MAAAREPGAPGNIPGAALLEQARVQFIQASSFINESSSMNESFQKDLAYDDCIKDCYNRIYPRDQATINREQFERTGLRALRTCAESIQMGNSDALSEYQRLSDLYLRFCPPSNRLYRSYGIRDILVDAIRDRLPHRKPGPDPRGADGGRRRTRRSRRSRRHHRK